MNNEKHLDSPNLIANDNNIIFSDFQSVKHFCILCIFSLGMYPFFWFFKHWQYLQDNGKATISPSFRTAFSIIYGYSLFTRFENLAIKKNYNKNLPLLLLFILFQVLLFTSLLKGSIILLFSIFAFIPLIPVHQMINFYYLKEQHDREIRKKLSKGEKRFLILIWFFLITMSFL